MYLIFGKIRFGVVAQVVTFPYKEGKENKQRTIMSNEINKGSVFTYFAEENV